MNNCKPIKYDICFLKFLIFLNILKTTNVQTTFKRTKLAKYVTVTHFMLQSAATETRLRNPTRASNLPKQETAQISYYLFEITL